MDEMNYDISDYDSSDFQMMSLLNEFPLSNHQAVDQAFSSFEQETETTTATQLVSAQQNQMVISGGQLVHDPSLDFSSLLVCGMHICLNCLLHLASENLLVCFFLFWMF